MNLLRSTLSRFALAPIDAASARAKAIQISQTWDQSPGTEKQLHSFVHYVQEGYRDNGIVFAVILSRLLLFSEATFRFLDENGDLTHSPALDILDRPWPKGRTADLLTRMEQDASLAGNSYTYLDHVGRRLRRLRPDWVDIVVGTEVEAADVVGTSASDLNAEVLAFLYWPGGREAGKTAKVLLPEDVAHYAPIPDPLALARGMSWLTPVAREIDADTAMTRHKGKFFENAATPNMVFKVAGELSKPVRERLEAALRKRYAGIENAYKTLLVEGGADVEVVGNTFEQISFAAVQAAGENRIAAAGGVPGIVVGLKEGLAAATYSNYEQAMRRFGDLTMRPLWRMAAGALEDLVVVPRGQRLWYYDRDIPALKQGAKDSAEIAKMEAEVIGSLVRSGYEPDTVIAAVKSGDWSKLNHSGRIPVTVQAEAPSGPGRALDVEVVAPGEALVDAVRHSDELVARDAEIADLRRQLTEARRNRVLVPVRDGNGVVTRIEEVDGAA